jgi:hypothetical protein
MRVLASAIGIVAACVPWSAGARENAIHDASSQILSLLMLDAGLTYHERKPARPSAAELRVTGIAPAPVGFKPLQPSLEILHLGVGGASPERVRLDAPSVDDDAAATPNADHWRDFTGIREMPDPPPTPGSYTDQMIVLSIRDLGRRPSVSVTGGMAGTALHILGADGTVQFP